MSSDLFDRHAELDPASSPDVLPDWEQVAPVLLEAINERTNSMQVQKAPPAPSREPRRRLSGRLIAAGAFMSVLVVAAVVGLLLQSQSEDVASGSSGVELVDEFVAALNSGDGVVSDYLTPDATYTRGSTLPIAGDLLAYWIDLETELDLRECQQTGESLVECQISHVNAVYRVMDRELTGSWLILLDDGRIARVLENVDEESLLDGSFPIEDYVAWLNSRHPEWLSEVEFIDPERGNQRFDTDAPALLPESFLVLNSHNAEMLMRYLDEYETELAATGGLPEPWSNDRWSNG